MSPDQNLNLPDQPGSEPVQEPLTDPWDDDTDEIVARHVTDEVVEARLRRVLQRAQREPESEPKASPRCATDDYQLFPGGVQEPKGLVYSGTGTGKTQSYIEMILRLLQDRAREQRAQELEDAALGKAVTIVRQAHEQAKAIIRRAEQDADRIRQAARADADVTTSEAAHLASFGTGSGALDEVLIQSRRLVYSARISGVPAAAPIRVLDTGRGMTAAQLLRSMAAAVAERRRRQSTLYGPGHGLEASSARLHRTSYRRARDFANFLQRLQGGLDEATNPHANWPCMDFRWGSHDLQILIQDYNSRVPADLITELSAPNSCSTKLPTKEGLLYLLVDFGHTIDHCGFPPRWPSEHHDCDISDEATERQSSFMYASTRLLEQASRTQDTPEQLEERQQPQLTIDSPDISDRDTSNSNEAHRPIGQETSTEEHCLS